MDSDLFTTGGEYGEYDGGIDGGKPDWMSPHVWKEANQEKMLYQQMAMFRWARISLYVVFLLLVVGLFYSLVVFIPLVKKEFNLAYGAKKEGLQYLGASTSVVRDDLGWPTNDSLAETAMRNQNRVTDISTPMPTKAAFSTRERMRSPEEELLRSQKK